MKKIILFLCFSAINAFAAQVIDVKIKTLDGFGGDTGSVISRCQTKVGAAYDPVMVTRDVNSLKNSGEFEEISADAKRMDSGVEVTYFVKRKIRYAAPLVVTGCVFFSESRIAKDSELKDGYLYGEADLAASAAKVRLAYLKKNFYSVKVTPVVKIKSGNSAEVKFVIEEGRRQKLNDYVFKGCVSVDEAQLHEAIGDLPWWNPIGWFSDRPVTDDQLSQCCDKIAEVYRNHGYLDVVVTGPERVALGEGEKVDLVFNIEEGVCYKIGEIKVTGVTRYPLETVIAKSALPAKGENAGEKILSDAAERIRTVVGSGDCGLADSRVSVKRVPAAENGVIDLVFEVVEGVPVLIDNVIVRGNDYTKDKVIRREIALGPGDRMLEDRAQRSQKRLENLDYFSRVRYYLEPSDKGISSTDHEYRNLVYEVEEKNTGSFMVGVGASSVDSVYLSAEVNQNNFDLFAPSKMFRGGGQKGRAYVAWGPRYQCAEVGVVEPYLFNRMLELSVDGYRRMRWYDQYDLIRSGGEASISYPVKFWPTWGPFGRFGVGLSGEFIEFDDVEDGLYEFEGKEVSFRQQEREYGDAFEPVVKLFWAKDSRDNFRIPTKGHRTRLYLDLAPAGDNEYWRLGFNHRSYFNVWQRYNHVLMAGIRAETIDGISDEVPIYNKMFLGGPKSIRGIEYRHVSPMAKTKKGDNWEPWGGQTLLCMNFEYTVPIVKMFRVAVFSDVGSVGVDEFDFDFSDNFAWTVGVGFRLDIPMFPIRLDFATPIEEPDHAEKEVFSFTIGYDF